MYAIRSYYVIALETPVPFKVHNKDLPHRKGKIGTHSGRFPQKASLEILQVLDNAKKNAEQKGLNTEKLRIKHISSNRGFTIKRYMPRAFGRASPKNQETIHIQVIRITSYNVCYTKLLRTKCSWHVSFNCEASV